MNYTKKQSQKSTKKLNRGLRIKYKIWGLLLLYYTHTLINDTIIVLVYYHSTKHATTYTKQQVLPSQQAVTTRNYLYSFYELTNIDVV